MEHVVSLVKKYYEDGRHLGSDHFLNIKAILEIVHITTATPIKFAQKIVY